MMTYEAEHKFDEESNEHACKECDRKFSKLSKLIKHITKKHLKVDEETEDKDLSDSSIIVEKDKSVSDDAEESIQDYSFEPPEDVGNNFVDGDPFMESSDVQRGCRSMGFAKFAGISVLTECDYAASQRCDFVVHMVKAHKMDEQQFKCDKPKVHNNPNAPVVSEKIKAWIKGKSHNKRYLIVG